MFFIKTLPCILGRNPFYLTSSKFFLEPIDSVNGFFFRERAKTGESIPIKIINPVVYSRHTV